MFQRVFPTWRLQLRQAQLAYRGGRLDEARQLLSAAELQQYLPAQRLAAKVAEELARRGRTHTQRGESSAGWRDLAAAEALGPQALSVDSLRQDLIQRVRGHVTRFLAAGEPRLAQRVIDRAGRRQGANEELKRLKLIVGKFENATRRARRGDFAAAEQDFAAALALEPKLRVLEKALANCRVKAERARRLSAELHAAMSACQWSKALGAAEAWLELAPDSPPAREARRRAWSAVGTRFQDTLPVTSETRVDDAADRPDAGRRFLMWIDAVGGYLVCTGDKIVLGQPVPGNHVDVPIMGDVSQRHAVIRRDGEGYLLEAIRPCRVDGRDVPGVAALADGATIELGDSVKLLFRRPHPLSATARLEFISGHRTQPATDGVLLMAGTCMLGPTANAHVICLDWQREMMLFEQQGELYCRTKGPFEIDGASCSDRGLVTPGSHVSGEDFSVQLEEI